MDRIGPSVALTNSAGGMRAMLTALKTNNIAGPRDVRERRLRVFRRVKAREDQTTGFGPVEVPLEEFKKLTKFPLSRSSGATTSTNRPPTRAASQKWKLFAEKINKYGGKAQVLMLPDAGLKGNTHIPFADMNNVAVADLLSMFLAEERPGQTLATDEVSPSTLTSTPTSMNIPMTCRARIVVHQFEYGKTRKL